MSQIPGILIIDKSQNMTSHDVVNRVRKLTGEKKVGHAGTLDPTATGVLIILIGKSATTLSDRLRGQSKIYQVEMKFGETTDSLDSDGITLKKIDNTDVSLKNLTRQNVDETLLGFLGNYRQQVPWFSAVKVGGKKLYSIARAKRSMHHNPGTEENDLAPPIKEVTIYTIDLIDFGINQDGYPTAKFQTEVSSGTYTRGLVRDIGLKLDIPTVQISLRRIKSGQFTIEQAKSIDDVTVKDIIPIWQIKV